MRKEPIPLRKELSALDRTKLGDYRVRAAAPISASVEAALGTTQYLDWFLEDESVKSRTDPRRFARLTVTYYTGTQDPVPHTAEVCFLGAGYQPKQEHETREVDLGRIGKIPMRLCTFMKTAIFNREELTVVYTFHANGQFAASRERVRATTTNLLTRHAYFSKVEVAFGDPNCQPRNLGRQESLAAAMKLFEVVLPVLIEDHWPDWGAVERSGTASPSGGA